MDTSGSPSSLPCRLPPVSAGGGVFSTMTRGERRARTERAKRRRVVKPKPLYQPGCGPFCIYCHPELVAKVRRDVRQADEAQAFTLADLQAVEADAEALLLADVERWMAAL